MTLRLNLCFKLSRIDSIIFFFAFVLFSSSLFASDRAMYQSALDNYDALLKIAVTPTGIRYDVLKKNRFAIDQYLYTLRVAKLESLQKNEKLALLVNAYNAFTLRLILDYWPKIKSIKDIPEYPVPRRFKDKRWKLSGKLLSLNEIVTNYITPLHVPTAYMALVCAARSCPDLRAGVYDASTIYEQLIESTKNYLSEPKALQWRMKKSLIGMYRPALYISELFRWKKESIEMSGYTILTFIEEFAPVDAKDFIEKYRENVSLIYLDYDWALNKSE